MHKVLFIKMWIFKNVVLLKIHPDERGKKAAVDTQRLTPSPLYRREYTEDKAYM